MARKTTPASFRDLVTAARQIMPDVAITTDIIAGFPGETEDEFAELLAFVKKWTLPVDMLSRIRRGLGREPLE